MLQGLRRRGRIRRVRIVFSLGCVALASCGPSAQVVTTEVPVVNEARAASCLATAPAVERALSDVRAGVEIGERTFALAWRWPRHADVDTVIVSLDAGGNLVETPINVPYADPMVLGAGPDELLVVSVPLRATGKLVRIAVGADGGLVQGASLPVPGVGWGWPHVVSSDGKTAKLHHSLAAQDQTIARSVELAIDLASLRVTEIGPGGVDPPDLGPASIESTFRLSARRPYLDGVVEVGWDGGHQLAHSPNDTNVRRYFEHWHFDRGEVRLLRSDGGTWTAVDPVPLALRDAKGTMHTGYEPVILRNGAHVAVLLAPEGHGTAWFQPYRGPCADPALAPQRTP